MSSTKTAVKINGQIRPIDIIETKLIEKELYNGRKPLRGEHTSRGVIKTDTIISGTISLRLTNNTAPFMLYIITGKQTAYSHVPETKTLFRQTLIPDYENPPYFSLIEFTDETAYETPSLKTTGFTIIQEENSPLKLKINLKTKSQLIEIIKPETEITESSKFFYLPMPMKIQADFKKEPTITIDSLTPLTEKPLIIEAFSREEYEPNRYGRFTIQINNYQFEKKLKSNRHYRSRCYGDMLLEIYIQE